MRRWGRPFAAIVASAAVVGWYFMMGPGAAQNTAGPAPTRAEGDVSTPRVDVLHPRTGGIERTSLQPGSVQSFETVELFAMVSGYLKSQNVDIGSRVKKGQILAEIDVPKETAAAAEAAAMLEQANAKAKQAESTVKAMEAERDSAKAAMAESESEIDRFVANRRLAESQYTRIKGIHEQRAIEKRLVDEHLRELESAQVAERTARLAVLTARARLAATTAKIEQARADVVEARAAAGVASARLARARVDLAYAHIVAPFDGVVTHRNFHPGSFIRSASGGIQLPLLTIGRIDQMRVVVRVPDRDVAFANSGDPAVVKIDGLEGREFTGTVSRVAESEDSTTRTMRVEIDLPNPDGLLREGMYGRVHISLEATSRRLTLPVACVLDRSGKGQGVVQVVRNGKIRRLKVQLGPDNGALVEVKTGLKPDDMVVVRSSTPLEDEMAVIARFSG
jgi:HlyD family secretion protein